MKSNALTPGRIGRRAGFTLIELLVVVSIMALLAALIVAGTIKFQETAVRQACKNQINSLQLKLNEQYGEVLAKCQKEQPPALVIEFCDGDRDRARAVHTAAMLRTNFPQTFAEAQTGISINGYPYNARATFKSVTGVTGGAAELEAAVLLYLILAERTASGGDTSTAGEKKTVKIGTSTKDFDVFVDPYGTPITYYRWARSDELNKAPYAHASPNPFNSKDPLDPKALVANWKNTLNRDSLNLGFDTDINTTPLNSRNRVPSVVSYGKDQKFDQFLPKDAVISPGPPITVSAGDDIVGYQLNRQGN